MFKRLVSSIDFYSIGMLLIFAGGNIFLCWLSKQIASFLLPIGSDYTLVGLLGILFFSAPAIFYESIFSYSNTGAWVSILAIIVGFFISADLRPKFRRQANGILEKVSKRERVMKIILVLIALPILLLIWAFQVSITLLMSFLVKICVIGFIIWPISLILGEPSIPKWLVPTFNILINIIILVIVIFAVTDEGE